MQKHVAILLLLCRGKLKYQATEFEKYLDEDGISYKEFTASDSNDIGSVVQSATEYADVIYIPTDNTMAQNTEAINNIALPAGTPIIAGEEGICKGCGWQRFPSVIMTSEKRPVKWHMTF